MILAQKQTHRSVEQNRDPRNKFPLIWSINLQQVGKIYNRGKSSLINNVGNIGHYVQKIQSELFSHRICKIKLKIG